MAKSLRSKTKRTYRNKKRDDGIYAATEAARLQRLNAKLLAVAKSVDEDSMAQDGEAEDADLASRRRKLGRSGQVRHPIKMFH